MEILTKVVKESGIDDLKASGMYLRGGYYYCSANLDLDNFLSKGKIDPFKS